MDSSNKAGLREAKANIILPIPPPQPHTPPTREGKGRDSLLKGDSLPWVGLVSPCLVWMVDGREKKGGWSKKKRHAASSSHSVYRGIERRLQRRERGSSSLPSKWPSS